MKENNRYRNEAKTNQTMSTNNRYYVDMEARFRAFQNGEIDMHLLHPMVYDSNNVALAVRQLSQSGGKNALGPDGTNYQTLSSYSIAELSEIVEDRLLNKKMDYVRRTYIPKSNGKNARWAFVLSGTSWLKNASNLCWSRIVKQNLSPALLDFGNKSAHITHWPRSKTTRRQHPLL